MRWSWIHWRCQFHTSAGTKYSLTISWSTGTIFAVDLWISSDIAFLTIHCVSHDSIFAIDSIPQLSLSFQWWFQGLQGLCFRWRFMDQRWYCVFVNSMSLLWLYFCYRFDALFVNSVTLSIPYVGCHSVFIDDFKVSSCCVFAGHLWISRDIAFLDNSMRQP